MFGGSDESPSVPSWLINGPSPGVRWAVEKYGSFGCFDGRITGLPLLVSSQGKLVCSRGEHCCLGALMGIPGVTADHYMVPLSVMRWIEKKNGSFGNFERESLVFTLLQSSSRKQVCSEGKYCCFRALMRVPGVFAGQYMAPCQK